MLRLHDYAYHRPLTVLEAAELLAAQPGRAMVVAGGTDLVPNMKHGLFTPAHVIALKQIAALHGIEERTDEVVIGAK
jgi:CO/xanthine dehydrogenase FAD-binding subunit